MSVYSSAAKREDSKVASAIKEFGWENVKREIVSECADGPELSFMEKWFIALYDTINNGYNKNRGNMTETDKSLLFEKRSAAISGEKHPLYGKKRSQEFKDCMKSVQRYKEEHGLIAPMSEEDKKKWSEMNGGKNNPAYNSDEFIFKNRKTGETFRGTRYEFRLKVGCNKCASSSVALGHTTYKGWKKIEGPIQVTPIATEPQITKQEISPQKEVIADSRPKKVPKKKVPQIFENPILPILESESNFIMVGGVKVYSHSRKKKSRTDIDKDKTVII